MAEQGTQCLVRPKWSRQSWILFIKLLFRLRPSQAAAEMVSCGACQSRAMGEEASWDTGNDARLGVPATGITLLQSGCFVMWKR